VIGGWLLVLGGRWRDADFSLMWITSGINRRCRQSGDGVNTTRISFPICPVSRLGRECAHIPFTSPLTPPRKERLGVKVAGPMRLALDLHLQAADPCYISRGDCVVEGLLRGISTGTGGAGEQFEELDALLVTLVRS
jgi:hypothetical protein